MNKIEPMSPFFTEFRDLLAERLHDWPDPELVDHDAQNLGLYLQDLRMAADLTPLELAEKTGLPEAEIVALEHGLIVSGVIKATHLHALAEVLEADIADFALILGRPDILVAVPVKQVSQAWWVYFNHRGLAILVAAVFGLILFGTTLQWWNAPTAIQTPPNMFTSVDRYEPPPYNWKLLSQVSLVVLLVILALWYGIQQRHTWTTALRGRSWQLSALATSLSLMLLMVFVPIWLMQQGSKNQVATSCNTGINGTTYTSTQRTFNVVCSGGKIGGIYYLNAVRSDNALNTLYGPPSTLAFHFNDGVSVVDIGVQSEFEITAKDSNKGFYANGLAFHLIQLFGPSSDFKNYGFAMGFTIKSKTLVRVGFSTDYSRYSNHVALLAEITGVKNTSIKLLLFSQTSLILSILGLMLLVIYREGRIAETLRRARKAMNKPELRPPR